jgi:hypothetical protein
MYFGMRAPRMTRPNNLQAHAAYTPTANETFDVTLEVDYPNAGSL